MKTLTELIEGALVGLTGLRKPRGARRYPGGETLSSIGWRISSSTGQIEGDLSITQDQRARHLYILGATGSGKTNLILQLLEQDIADKRTIVVIDLRGDLLDRVYKRLAPNESAAERTTILDLRDQEHIVGFNPLVGPSDPHSRAYLVLDALKSHADSWGIQLDETLRNSLIALSFAQKTLVDLEQLLTEPETRSTVLAECPDPSVHLFFGRYSALSEDRQQSWYLPVLNKVTPFLGLPRLRQLFGATNCLSIAAELNAPGRILLIGLAVDRLHSAAKLVGSLVIGSIESAVMSRVDTPESARNPINLYVDEFETMASQAFETIVAEGRRFRLSLTLSHQNLSQISQSLRQVLRNNVQTQVFFQTGSIDARELRHDLSVDGEDVIELLQKLPTGQAYLKKRPDNPLLVRFKESRDPGVTSEKLAGFVELVHKRMGSKPPEKDGSFLQRKDLPVRHSPKRTFKHSRKPRSMAEEAE